MGNPGLGPVSLPSFLSLWAVHIVPLPFPSHISFSVLSILTNLGSSSSSCNGNVSSSCNTLENFFYVSLISHFSLCLSFLSVFFFHWFQFGGNLSLCSHLPDYSLALFLSPCYHFCFVSLVDSVLLFIYSVLLFHGFLSPTDLFVGLFNLFSPLWFYSLFATPLAAIEYIFLPLYHAVYALHLSSLILFWNVASILHISSYFQSCGILCSIDKESPPQLCTIPSYRVPCYLCIMQNFLQCLNWRHLSHKVGFSFFICSWMLSLPIIICGFRLCFSNSSLKIGRPISLLSSSLQGTRMSTTSLEYIFIISSFMNSARSLLYTVLHWGSIF